MERIRRYKYLIFISLALATAILSSTCDNPVNMLDEVQVEVMKANDRYLEVTGVLIPVDGSGLFNPTGTLEITFDREIDLASVGPLTIVVKSSNGDTIDYPLRGVSYVSSSHTIKLRVYPFLPINSEISLTVSGVKGTDGSVIHDIAARTFTTKNVLAGSVNSMVGHDAASLAGYTITNALDFQVQVTDYYRYFKYRISVDGGVTWAYDYGDMASFVDRFGLADGLLDVTNFPLSNLGIATEGQIDLVVQFGGNDTGTGSPVDGLTDVVAIYYDDTNPSAGIVSLNSASVYVNSSTVTSAYITAPADAHSGLGSMRFSNNGSTWSSWEAYGASKSWNLVTGAGGAATQGSRTVYAQVRDLAGNISTSASDAITYDIGGPSPGTWQVNANAAYTAASGVTFALTVAPSDSYSGVSSISYSNNGSTWSTWETYTGASKSWSLSTGSGGSTTQGSRTVYVRLIDGAGNVSTSASDAIVYDYSAPSAGAWVLNTSAPYTNVASNTLSVSTAPSDSYSGIAQMCFSNNGSTYTTYEAYATSKTWDITNATYGGSTAEGTKYTYVKVKDSAGNESTYTYDSIVYDYTVPTVGVWRINANATYVNNATVTVAYTTSPSDARSGIAKMRFSNDNATWSAWETYVSSKSWNITNASYGGTTTEGTKNSWVQVQDGAGNSSASTNDAIVYDITPPTGYFYIGGSGNPASITYPSLTMYLYMTDNLSGVAERRFYNGTTWLAYEPYTATKYWNLAPGNGSKTVYAYFKDGAGNITSPYITDTISLEATYGSLILVDIAGDRTDLSGDSNAYMSTSNINLSDGYIAAGQIYVYYTSSGRYGKLEIMSFNASELIGLVLRYNVITFRLTTYNADGTVYSSSASQKIWGTYHCDLDAVAQTSTGSDFWWRIDSATARYLVPENAARFYNWN